MEEETDKVILDKVRRVGDGYKRELEKMHRLIGPLIKLRGLNRDLMEINESRGELIDELQQQVKMLINVLKDFKTDDGEHMCQMCGCFKYAIKVEVLDPSDNDLIRSMRVCDGCCRYSHAYHTWLQSSDKESEVRVTLSPWRRGSNVTTIIKQKESSKVYDKLMERVAFD